MSTRRPIDPPAPSFPSLTTLFSQLPPKQGLVTYSNDDLFGPHHVQDVAAWRRVELTPHTEQQPERQTHSAVAAAVVQPPRTNRWSTVALAFVLGAATALTAHSLANPTSSATQPMVATVSIGTIDLAPLPHEVAEGNDTNRHSTATIKASNGPVTETGQVIRLADVRIPSQRSASQAAAPVSQVQEPAPATTPDDAPRTGADNAAADLTKEQRTADLLAEVLAVPPEPVPFDVDAAAGALASALGTATACGDGVIRGEARVSVTFAHSGRVTTAIIASESPLAGTAVGSCVARAMYSATVPAYEGDIVTVRRWVHVR